MSAGDTQGMGYIWLLFVRPVSQRVAFSVCGSYVLLVPIRKIVCIGFGASRLAKGDAPTLPFLGNPRNNIVLMQKYFKACTTNLKKMEEQVFQQVGIISV